MFECFTDWVRRVLAQEGARRLAKDSYQRVAPPVSVLVIFLAIVAWPSAVSAAGGAVTLLVSSSSGGDTGNCTSSPCATIQYAVTQAERASYSGYTVTIEVAGGPTYDDAVIIDASSLGSLTIDGAGVTVTTLNDGGSGPDVTVDSGTVTVENLTITGGLGAECPWGGGGVLNGLPTSSGSPEGAGTVYLIGDDISGDTSNPCAGGGVANFGTVTLTDDTLSDDSAPDGGGGIFNSGYEGAGTATLTDDTFSDDQAPAYAGGAIRDYIGTSVLTDDTISGNSAADGGGGVYNQSGTVTLADSLLADNAGGDCASDGGGVIDHGYNVADDGSCSFGQESINSSPSVGALTLAANGSSGPETEAITASSSAFREVPPAACTVTTDERGEPRPGFLDRNCDAGAFEVQGEASSTETTVENSAGSTWVDGDEVTGASAHDTAIVSAATPTGSGQVTPTGTVTFGFYDNSSCTAPATTTDQVGLEGSGSASSESTAALAAGSYSFGASYSGDNVYNDSASSCEQFDVGPAGAPMSTAPATSSIVFGSSDTEAAEVSGNAGGGSPTGTVSFYECGPTPSPADCASKADEVGSAVSVTAGAKDTSTAISAAFTPTAAGYWCFANYYSGDPNYLAGSDTTRDECFDVTRQPTTTVVRSSLTPSLSGQSVSFTALVSADATRSATPTGQATFAVTHESGNSVAFTCESGTDTVTLRRGSASCTLPAGVLFADDGPYNVGVTYGGDSNYLGSSGDAAQSLVFASLAVRSAASSSEPVVGSDDTITLTAYNAGESTTGSGKVVVADELPRGLDYASSVSSTGPAVDSGQRLTWTIPGLSPGASTSLRIVVVVETTSKLSDWAAFTATTPNSSGGTTGESNTVTITPAYAVLGVSETVTNHTPAVGSQDQFTAVVTNTGPDTARDVTVTDPLPAGVSFMSDRTAPHGSVREGIVNGVETLEWNLGALAVGASATLDVIVLVTANSGSLINPVTATDSTFDPTGQAKHASASAVVAALVVVPPTHTGEPWSGWTYWLLLLGLCLAGLIVLDAARRGRGRVASD
jgi:uncharacterized repeat protein (TIGR01451 family)